MEKHSRELERAARLLRRRVKAGAHHVERVVSQTPSSTAGAALLATMVDPMRQGPFSVLWHALQERATVRVVVRRLTTVRGSCVGLLRAFDRHMNLVLVDVAETYSPTMRSQKARDRHITRFVKQLFIRGDTVVLVTRADHRDAAKFSQQQPRYERKTQRPPTTQGPPRRREQPQ